MRDPATAVYRLRAATAEAHRALDATLDPVVRLRAPAGRIALLRGYHRLHATAEAAMAPHLASDPALEFAARRRVPALLADLAALGAPPPADPAADLPLATRAAALGTLYVMEGSTLGAALILRQLQIDPPQPGPSKPGPPQPGLSFLNPYGPRTGRMWRIVLDLLERDLAGNPPALDDAVAAALATFRLAASCLAPAECRQAA